MSAFLHLNLLKEEEQRSPSPIRLRVLLPTLAGGLALAPPLWSMLRAVRLHAQSAVRDTTRARRQELTPAHTQLLALRAQEKELSAIARQLRLYERSRIRFGDTLRKIPERVPANIQFTEMRVPPPPPPAVDPKQPALGPTNSLEKVSLRIAGRTSGEKASVSVDTLLAALRAPGFTNRIQAAEIPKGAFRQDTVNRASSSRDILLFEITCECAPRRFE